LDPIEPRPLKLDIHQDGVEGCAFRAQEFARFAISARPKRVAKFGLELHPDKTHVLRFGRCAQRDCVFDHRVRPGPFEFLGFTHISAQGSDGRFRIVRRSHSPCEG